MNLLPNCDDITYTRSRRARAVNGTWYTISSDCHDLIGTHVLIVDGRRAATIIGRVDAYNFRMTVRGQRDIWGSTISELMTKAETMIAHAGGAA